MRRKFARHLLGILYLDVRVTAVVIVGLEIKKAIFGG